MRGSDLVLEASREGQKLKISVYEQSVGREATLRPYEDNEPSWSQVDVGCHEIIGLLNRANRHAKVTFEILEALRKTGQLLFDLLIPPKTREKLSSATTEALILYIDDKLVSIPWELLYDGREFLSRRFAIGRIVRTRQVPTSFSSRAVKPPLRVLVLADPQGDLSASYHEGTEIRDSFDGKLSTFEIDLKSWPINLAFVKKNLRDYDVVHYAGHAAYDSRNPSESGWLLADGRLRPGEISAMGGLQSMPALVFSNACQSGQTDEWQIDEGYEQQIFGLANAYLLAGVRHYIGTFWEILDEPSSYFAKQFYSFLAQGNRIGEAVRRARLELIKAYGEETIVWASYMLYGDPTFRFAAEKLEVAEGSAEPEASLPVWSEALRGEPREQVLVVKRRHSPWGYATLGILMLVLGFAGYSFWPDLEQGKQLAATAVVLEPDLPQKEVTELQTEKQAGSPEKSEVKKPLGEPARTPGPIPLSVAKRREPTSVKSTKPQGASLPTEVGAELALKTEPAPVVTVPLSVSMNIIGQRKEPDGSYSEVIVREGGILRSHDNFQVHLETNRAAYVYILIYDSQGKASQLFPDPKIDHAGFAKQGARLVVPANNLWFWLDESTGTETIYLLASEKPMSDIQGLLAKMEAADEDGKRRFSQELKQKIVQRGLAVVAKGQSTIYTLSDGKKIQKVTDVVTGTGSVVRAVSFQHR